MPESALPDPTHAALSDPWEVTPPIPLDGVLERNKYAPVLTAVVALVVGLILFQVISAVAMIGLLLMRGVALDRMLADLPSLIEEQAAVFLSANSIGQVLGLALLAWLLARMHSSRAGAFLRWRKTDVPLVFLALLGLVALTPLVQWAGVLNESVPLPDFLRELESSQLELIEKMLGSDLSVVFNLAMLALTPALCEELFFRGYVQRQFERGLGVVGGVLATGILFGVYHLRLSQAVPLSLLGIYLAFLAWRTGSLWVPIIVHFANNALAVVAAAYVTNRPDLDISDLDTMEVPWYIGLAGLVFFAGVVYAMNRWISALPANRQAATVPDQ